MTVHLPKELEQFLQASVTNGRFASEDEAIVEAVRLLRQAELAAAHDSNTNDDPVWKRTLEAMKSVPDEVFAAIPADGAEQLNHYIYGVPRRPAS